MNNNLGCGKEINIHSSTGFICGVADAWGYEKLCPDCKLKLRARWAEEDRKRRC
jgi:hypothetical protein